MKISKEDIKIYVAASISSEYRKDINYLVRELRSRGYYVYAPLEHEIENAWDWPNDEWGLQVFRNDIDAINECNVVIVLSWGRKSTTAGTCFEQGYAYATGKKVLFVEMNDERQSLMCANGRYATVQRVENAIEYPFEDMFDGGSQTRTNTFQT